jgi:hypothetical protein
MPVTRTRPAAPKPEVALPPLVAKAKLAYEEELKTVNGLRQILMTTLEQYQRSVFTLMKARSRYVRLSKKAGLEVPGTPWWEKDKV